MNRKAMKEILLGRAVDDEVVAATVIMHAALEKHRGTISLDENPYSLHHNHCSLLGTFVACSPATTIALLYCRRPPDFEGRCCQGVIVANHWILKDAIKGSQIIASIFLGFRDSGGASNSEDGEGDFDDCKGISR
ncbi:LON peptidase N-terminal domain and RING finger protein 2 isoform [Sesbania bispinosa]|nr:LON peptidase N-terminal domain and RING finger protein 2 isoform [Sesbania bispinosa]